MFEIFNFPGIELIGFILILGVALIVEEKITKIDALIEEIELDLVDEMERED